MLKYVFIPLAAVLFAASLFINYKLKSSVPENGENEEKAVSREKKLRAAIYVLDAAAAAFAIAGILTDK